MRSRVERLELSRAELRGPMLREFLDACGVSVHGVRVAERDAREIARRMGGAIVEVRMGELPRWTSSRRPSGGRRRYGVSTSAFSTGQIKPNVGCGWNDAASAVGLPNHLLLTGAFTFLPVRPLSILSTSTPR